MAAISELRSDTSYQQAVKVDFLPLVRLEIGSRIERRVEPRIEDYFSHVFHRPCLLMERPMKIVIWPIPTLVEWSFPWLTKPTPRACLPEENLVVYLSLYHSDHNGRGITRFEACGLIEGVHDDSEPTLSHMTIGLMTPELTQWTLQRQRAKSLRTLDDFKPRWGAPQPSCGELWLARTYGES